MAKSIPVFCAGCALAFVLSMAGCAGTAPSAADAETDAAQGAGADAAQDAAQGSSDSFDAAVGVDFSDATRVVIRDAATGEQLAEVTDPSAMTEAFAPFSGEQGISLTPDAPEEYRFEVWQRETDESGDVEPDGDEFEAYEITTYQGSDTIRMKVVLLDISFSMTPESGAENLRQLLESAR